ncbi:E3 ubiquitin-protein ligase RNF5-like protein, partial [Lates japonicus]
MAAADPRSSSDGGPASRGGFPAGESSSDRDGPGGGSGSGSSGDGERERDRATFECNICLDTARDAVISMCGHLFCGWRHGPAGSSVLYVKQASAERKSSHCMAEGAPAKRTP